MTQCRLLTASEVLRLIEPADPESLRVERSTGTWTAKWCPPIPGADTEALRRTPGVTIVRDEYEAGEGLYGWIAVDFTIDVEPAGADDGE